MRIDPSTVYLENEAGDWVGRSLFSYQDIDRDENTDLLIKFRTSAVVHGLGLDQEEHGTIVTLHLTGALTDPDENFIGQDYILIINKKTKQ